MNRLFAIACLLVVLARPGAVAAREPGSPGPSSVQIALLLDTSNSMDGLIAQAKTQLWAVVNEFLAAEKDGRPPRVEVALYEYGNNGLGPEEGFVRLVLPLTDDLDRVSEELFRLTTDGGEEYCGQVIRDAAAQLCWDPSGDVYKAIFIAGNEPFTQGSVDFRPACRAAVGRGILVNTIHCGDRPTGEQTGWMEGATLADGQFMTIDPDHQVVQIPAPQDEELARLNEALNATYIPYGRIGREGQLRQVAQDQNALAVPGGDAAARFLCKASQNYNNAAWDLVDAIRTGRCALEDVKDEDLPEDLRTLGPAQRKARVEDTMKRREAIQGQILGLSARREAFLARERARQSDEGQDTLGAAIIEAIRGQAARLDFSFEGAARRP